jgi:DNA-binding IclR family transcriptional regulator
MTQFDTAPQELAAAVRDSKAPAISRAAAVLRLLGKSDTPVSLQTTARDLGLAPSTCLYVLRALVAEAFVAFDPDTKRYALEAGVLALARQWLRHDRFTDLVQPGLDRIAETFSVTTMGVQIVGLDHIIVVASAQTSSAFQLGAEVGSRFPALISATGRCIAAFGGYPEAELEARFDALRWDRPPRYKEWLRQAQRTRLKGYGLDEGNYMAGVTVIAAPVWKAGGRPPTHALVAIAISSNLKTTRLAQAQAALVSEADDLTRQLGGRRPVLPPVAGGET